MSSTSFSRALARSKAFAFRAGSMVAGLRHLAWRRANGRVAAPAWEFSDGDLSTATDLISQQLEEKSEEAAKHLAALFRDFYLSFSKEKRAEVLRHLAGSYGLDARVLRNDVDRYLTGFEDPDSYCRMRDAVLPPRRRFLQGVSLLPDGLDFLVQVRSDLLECLESAPELEMLDYDLRELLDLWFAPRALIFKEISWDSSAALLETVIKHDRVHRIQSWNDLKNRLGQSRRCYGLFHPGISEGPVAFVEIALTDGIPQSIAGLLESGGSPPSQDNGRAATFYSISNTRAGLKGLDLGRVLLKQAVTHLSQSDPNLKNFVTLSPIPGFCRWLRDQIQSNSDLVKDLWDEKEMAAVLNAILGVATVERTGDTASPEAADAGLHEAMRLPLTSLCARYLTMGRPGDGLPIDPVARFHVRNGASVDRICWMADPSPSGLRASLGLMVNYRYDRLRIVQNERAARSGGEIPASEEVRRSRTSRSRSFLVRK